MMKKSVVDKLLLAEGVSIDSDGKVTAFQMFDVVVAPSLPTAPAKFALAISMIPGKDDIVNDSLQFEIVVKSPAGKQIASIIGDGVAEYGDEWKGYKAIVSSVDLSTQIVFEEPGLHSIQVVCNKKALYVRKFIVRVVKEGDEK